MDRTVFFVVGVGSVIVAGEEIGTSIHRMGLQELNNRGQPVCESLLMFISGFVGSSLRATLVYVGMSAGGLALVYLLERMSLRGDFLVFVLYGIGEKEGEVGLLSWVFYVG